MDNSKNTTILKINPTSPDLSILQKGGEVIQGGGVFIFPTDTIYGLGCNVFNESAVKTIFKIKQRSAQNPLPVLINRIEQLSYLINEPLSEIAKNLIKNFWPGPLTLILPANSHIPESVTGGTKTIGVRMPNSPFVLSLISYTRVPLIATSVNISGQPPLNESKEIIAQWKSKVDLILDGGDVKNQLASTIIDLTVSPPHLIREEAIGAQQLQPYFTISHQQN